MIYIMGSLRSPDVPTIAQQLRQTTDHEIFDDWHSAGRHADDAWRDYERRRGHSYMVALTRHPARHTFALDQFHLHRAHGGILVLPAGRSAHLEAGIMAGQGKPTFLLLHNGKEPARFDVMTQFFSHVCPSVDHLVQAIRTFSWPKLPILPTITVEDSYWLAGLLEGEGSFCITGSVPRLVLQMTDRDVVARAAILFDSKVWGGTQKTKGGKLVWACGTSGLKAIEYMRLLAPMLGFRRRRQICTTVERWLNQRKYHRTDELFWRRLFGLDINPLASVEEHGGTH